MSEVKYSILLRFMIRLHSLHASKQGPIKPRVVPGPDVHSGPYSKRPKILNIFDELKYVNIQISVGRLCII